MSSSYLPPKILAQPWALSIPPPSPGYSVKCEYTAHKEGVLKEEMLLASETGDGACLKVVVQARVMGKGCRGAGGVCPGPGCLSCPPPGVHSLGGATCSCRGPRTSKPPWVWSRALSWLQPLLLGVPASAAPAPFPPVPPIPPRSTHCSPPVEASEPRS